MKIGDKVKYTIDDKEKRGTIHGIRKAQVGKTERIIGYIIDTGKPEYKMVNKNEKGKDETFIQPVFDDVEASQVTPV